MDKAEFSCRRVTGKEISSRRVVEDEGHGVLWAASVGAQGGCGVCPDVAAKEGEGNIAAADDRLWPGTAPALEMIHASHTESLAFRLTPTTSSCSKL